MPRQDGKKITHSKNAAEPKMEKTNVCRSKPKELRILIKMPLTLMGRSRIAERDKSSPAKAFL